MLLTMLLFAAAQDRDPISQVLDAYHQATRAEVPCRQPESSTEIVVCSLRDADRDRVPFVSVIHAADSVPLRTDRLTRNYNDLPCGQGAITTNCGFVGVTTRVGFDGRAGLVQRELAH